MRLDRVTKDSDVKLAGISSEIEWVGGTPRAVMLRDESGGLLKVASDYSLSVLVPAPPKKVKKFRLTGKFAGLVDICEDFEYECDAKVRKSEYERVCDASDGTELRIDAIEVEEAE